MKKYIFAALVFVLTGCPSKLPVAEGDLETIDVSKSALDDARAKGEAARNKALEMLPPDVMEASGRLEYFLSRRDGGYKTLDDTPVTEFDPTVLLYGHYPSFTRLSCDGATNATEDVVCKVDGRVVQYEDIRNIIPYIYNEDVWGLGPAIVCGEKLCYDATTHQPIGIIQPVMRAFNSNIWYGKSSIGEDGYDGDSLEEQ